MKSFPIWISVIILTIVLLLFYGFQSPKPMTNFPNDPFTKDWQTVDSLDNQGLPQSARIKVHEILKKAETDQNPSQIVKAVLYLARYTRQLEENGEQLVLEFLEEKISNSPFPVPAILQSHLAMWYHQYLETNHWRISQRTQNTASRPEDFQTWATKDFLEYSSELFWASVANQQLKQIPLDDFKAILAPTTEEADLRPTLYDLLAHRAIDFFTSDRSFLHQPTNRFYLDQADLFGPPQQFHKLELSTQDSSSGYFQALLLMQDLTDFRRREQNIPALLDLELKRLQFVYNHSIHPEKDKLYQAALDRHIQEYRSLPQVTDFYYLKAIYYQQRGSQLAQFPEGDPRIWDLQKAQETAQQAISLFPKSRGAKQCQNLLASLEAPEFSIRTEEVWPSDQAALVQLNYKNVETAYFRLIRIDQERADEIQKAWRRDREKVLKKILSMKTVKRWEQNLKKETDLRKHHTEIAIDPQEYGRYLLLASDEKNFKGGNTGFLYFQISDLGYFQRGARSPRQEIYVVDRKNGNPQAGVTVECWEETYNSVFSRYESKLHSTQTSDKDGQAALKIATQNHSYSLLLKRQNDTLHLDERYSNYYRPNKTPRQEVTRFFLDRAIYRPGQTVYFKAVLLQKDEDRMPSILKNQKVTVTLRDANYQEVENLELRSNEYGTVHGSFIAPQGGLLGQMQLLSSVGGTSQYFRVEEYKRPRFEVSIEAQKGEYRLDEQVEVKGLAKGYAGNPVDGALVRYRVVRKTFYPYAPWWMYRYSFSQNSQEIAFGETQTAADGSFTIPFLAASDPAASHQATPVFKFEVIADVIDVSGETQSGKGYIKASTISLNPEILVKDRIPQNEFKKIPVEVLNLAGDALVLNGTLQIDRLQAPTTILTDRLWEQPDRPVMPRMVFKGLFPNLPYQDEQRRETWEVDQQIGQYQVETQPDAAIDLSGKMLATGFYKLTFSVLDSEGKTITQEKWIEVFDPQKPNTDNLELVWLQASNPKYRVGETMELVLASGRKGQKVFLEILRGEDFLFQNWVEPGQRLVVDRKIEEADRGGISYQYAYAGMNRAVYNRSSVIVPWDNKELDIEYLSFRDKLMPGQEETWEIKIKGPQGDQVAAELLATMYDASLDQFAPNAWNFREFPMRYSNDQTLATKGFGLANLRQLSSYYPSMVSIESLSYPLLLDFGFTGFGYGYYGRDILLESVVLSSAPASTSSRKNKSEAQYDEAVPQTYTAGAPPEEPVMIASAVDAPPPPPGTPTTEEANNGGGEETQEPAPAVRENLNETVFFFPDLKTDAEGNVRIQFKMNEALTRWKFLTFGLTQELETCIGSKEIITQKDLMVLPNPPRFYRERDQIVFSSKVVNLSEETLTGEAWIALVNPLNDQSFLPEKQDLRQKITLEPGQSIAVQWPFTVPDVAKVPVIQHTVYARAGQLTDAERAAAPVLSNRMLVTESLPLPVRGESDKTFTLQSLAQNSSSTLSHESITLEFTSNPAWYAVQALPYLMEYPYECSEQIFSRYYANSLATSVANAHPRIKAIFEAWKGTDAMKSNLAKNEELKSALLAETPWVLQAQSEEAQKKNIGLLFDLNRMAREQQIALDKLSDRQLANGGFPWFPGGRDNWYITQYLVEGLGHLHQLGVSDVRQNANTWRMTKDAVQYIDAKLVEHYEDLARQVKKGYTKWEDDHLDQMVIHYLYARSFFLQEKSAQASTGGTTNQQAETYLALTGATQKAVDYYLEQADQYWLKKGLYGQGMLGLSLHRLRRTQTPSKITASLKERALENEEMGTYWKYPGGFFWYEYPIETHALLIELFSEVAQDADMVEGMKVWLLKSKQTQHWRTTKATASAVYALLMNGDNWLLETAAVDIAFGTKQNQKTSDWKSRLDQAQAKGEAGTGYFKVRFDGSEVEKEMATVTVKNPNKGISWGALFWQYFEDLDKIESFEETPLTLKKQVFLVENSTSGEQLTELADQAQLQPGDKLKIRIELRVDRPMEYVHMKDMRASGFEPINVLSQYKWQGGLGYYESTKDASTDFFFSYLPKGTHVFEYPLRVNLSGDFSNGVTTIQCMYAPEFTSHSEGIRLRVD